MSLCILHYFNSCRLFQFIYTMTILESELEDLIFNKIQEGSFDDLIDRGLHLSRNAKYFRQYNFGSYGIADIVSLAIVKQPTYWEFNLSIYELKKDAIGAKTLCQAARYAKAAQRMVDDWNYRYSNKRRIMLSTNIHLIGQSVDGGGFLYFPDLFKNVYIYQYRLEFDGNIL